MKKKTNWKLLISSCIAIGAIVFLLALLSSSDLKNILSTKKSTKTLSSMVCTSSNPKTSNLFENENTSNTIYEIRATFEENGNLKNIFSSFGESYESKEKAEIALPKLRAKQDSFMGNNSIDPSTLAPTYKIIENKIAITYFADNNNFSSHINPLFFLSDGQNGNNINELSTFYQTNGFECIIKTSKQN